MADLSEVAEVSAGRLQGRVRNNDGDDKTAFHSAAWDALTIASAEPKTIRPVA